MSAEFSFRVGDDLLEVTVTLHVSFLTRRRKYRLKSKETSYTKDKYKSADIYTQPDPVRLFMTIGDRRDPDELGPLPASIRVERWVPQAAVMPRASAVVGHGGSGSTLAALAAGVPQALVPLFVDGPANARRVAEIGAGIAVEDGPANLGRAVAALLADAGYRAA